jgi:cytochrome P450
MKRAQLDVNLLAPEIIQDPYPMYEQIRALGNVVWNGLLNAWTVVGYDEGAAVLSDEGDKWVMLNSDPEIIPWFHAPNMITVDGDYHRRLRGPLAPLFTARAVAHWERRVTEVVDDLLTPLVRGSNTFDLIGEFTMLPTVIVAEMLGVPQERHADFRAWSHEIVSGLAYGAEDPSRRELMLRAAREVNEYLSEEIERHRREQPDDLLTTMVNFSGDGRMTDEEIRSTAVLFLIAGYDTTAKTMSNTLISLEANPSQRELVARDLSLVPAAIEESMRWYGSVQSIPRKAVSDIMVGDTAVAAGEDVHVFVAGCNRDPRRWPDPERFDVTRERKTHLAFGRGPHLCLGAALARIEVKVAIARLLQVVPNYELHNIDFGHAFFVRGPESGLITAGSAAS